MQTHAELKSSAENGGAVNLAQYFGTGATAYYLNANGDEQSTSQWYGKGAAFLGLSGKVEEEVFTNLLWGIGPKGEKLRQNAGEKPQWIAAKNRDGSPKLDENGEPAGHFRQERLGYDFCYSPDKTVSNIWAIGMASDDLKQRELAEAIHQASRRSAMRQLTFLEDYAETRRGAGSKDHHQGEGLVIGTFDHFTARGHGKGVDGDDHDDAETIDEQIHHHCVIMNVCLADGRFSALEAGEMLALERTTGAMYRNDLASELQKLGLTLDYTPQLDQYGHVIEGAFKVVGVPEIYRSETSGRRHEITEYQAEHPEASSQEANLATRRDKKEPTFKELVQAWREKQADFRRRHPEQQLPERITDLIGLAPSEEEQLRRQQRAQQTQREFDDEVLDKLHETQSVFRKRDLLRVIAEKTVGEHDAKGVIGLANAFLARQEGLAVINPERLHEDDMSAMPSRRYKEFRFSDRKRVLEMEQGLVDAAKARGNETQHHLDPKVVDQCMADFKKKRGFALSDEQQRSVRFATQESGGVCLIKGRAGSGKTTSCQVITAAFEQSGYRVLGTATGNDAAQKLEAETGVKSRSITKMLNMLEAKPGKKPKLEFTDKTLLVIDEAGMLGTRPCQKLLAKLHAAGGKAILQGDHLQLQAVDAGSPMRALDQAIGSFELTEIRRQRAKEGVDLVQKFYAAGGTEKRSRAENLKFGRSIMMDMEAQGHLHDSKDRKDLIREMMAAYVADSKPDRQKILLAGTNKDIDELTGLLRQAKKHAGLLGDDKEVLTKSPKADHPVKLNVAVGERIRFRALDEDLGVVNGTVAVINSITPGKDGKAHIDATIESDIAGKDGKKIHFRSDQVAFGLGWASTVHRSQGQSLESVYHLYNPKSMDRQLAMVAFSRHKGSYTLFMQTKDKDTLHRDEQLATDRLQVNALEEGVAFNGRSTKDLIAEQRAKKAQAQTEAQKAPKLDADTVLKAAEAFKRVRDHVPPTLSEAVRRGQSQGQGRGRGQGL
jgi:conjugative relaxase-like TrwC/TraI family protein